MKIWVWCSFLQFHIDLLSIHLSTVFHKLESEQNTLPSSYKIHFFMLWSKLYIFRLFLPRIESIWTPGSVCPSPIPPTAGQPCSQLPEPLDCHYENSTGLTVNCCCGQCDVDMTCAPDSTTGSGLWQPMHSPLCPADGCGSQGNRWKIILSSSWKPQDLVSSPHQTTLASILTTSTRRRP